MRGQADDLNNPGTASNRPLCRFIVLVNKLVAGFEPMPIFWAALDMTTVPHRSLLIMPATGRLVMPHRSLFIMPATGRLVMPHRSLFIMPATGRLVMPHRSLLIMPAMVCGLTIPMPKVLSMNLNLI